VFHLARASAHLHNASPDEAQHMTPIDRERLRLACAYWAEKLKPRPPSPRSGVLLDLRVDGRGQQ
jgi:hypothetical protein